jgi:hypothetical protein
MKNYLLAAGLLLAGPIAAYAQFTPPPVDSSRGKIAYSTVIQVPGATQAQLYGRALKWLATVQPHATTDPAVKDAASGTLATRLGIPFTAKALVGSMECTLWRELSVTVRDGKAKFESSEFTIQPYVATAAAIRPPTTAQIKLTPAEEYLNRGNVLYYTKQGQPKTYVASVLGAIEQQTASQLASLKAALNKSDDF